MTLTFVIAFRWAIPQRLAIPFRAPIIGTAYGSTSGLSVMTATRALTHIAPFLTLKVLRRALHVDVNSHLRLSQGLVR